jgi:hypothetical protein
MFGKISEYDTGDDRPPATPTRGTGKGDVALRALTELRILKHEYDNNLATEEVSTISEAIDDAILEAVEVTKEQLAYLRRLP